MESSSKIDPDLETRFLAPEGWRWHTFRNVEGKCLRFGTVYPKTRIPNAVVICLPGLSEFAEKYYEVARNLLDYNLSFWIMEWQGQGKSQRYGNNPHKRHTNGFQKDVDDLDYFINEYVKHSAVHPDVGRIPLVMLAHSMGANIGLRYLHDHPESFTCAALSNPMLGLASIKHLPLEFSSLIFKLVKLPIGAFYVPGGSNWRESWRMNYGQGPFSGDPDRDKVHNAWCRHDPELQCGSVSLRWLSEALNSCNLLMRSNYLESIQTPCIMSVCKKEKFVDNDMIYKASKRMPNCTLVEYEDAWHEILMERDEIRNNFLESFCNLIQEHVVSKPETLKPF